MPVPLLEGHQEYVKDPLAEETLGRMRDLEKRVAELEHDRPQIERDAVMKLLNLLAHALRHVASGQMDMSEVPTSSVAAPQFDPRWEAWKQKLGAGTAPARVIDAILNHGPLSRTQLRAAGELGWSTLDAATARLKNLGLIEKVGDRWNLKS
jgi:hypothetical protein